MFVIPTEETPELYGLYCQCGEAIGAALDALHKAISARRPDAIPTHIEEGLARAQNELYAYALVILSSNGEG